MRVAICDDEVSAINKTKQFLSAYTDAKIFEFTSMAQIINFKDKIDIVFLDMMFGENSGFEVAEHLQKTNPNCIITFFTNYSVFMKQSFEYRAFRYILKEEPHEFIQKQIDATVNEYYSNNRRLQISYKNTVSYIDINEIEYIEMINHTAHINLKNDEKYLWYNTLENIMTELPKNFVRCSRSYIINLQAVKQMYNNQIILRSNTAITIGVRYKKEIGEFLKNIEKRNG